MKIEKGIPIPTPLRGSALIDHLKRMEVGDSIFIEGKKSSQMGKSIVRWKEKTGHQYTTRNVEGGVRIWRVYV